MIAPMSIFMLDLAEVSSLQIYATLADLPAVATTSGLPVAFMLGCLLALMVFRYLFNNRASNMVHSLPIRRETLFITQYITGLSFVIIPNIFIALLSCVAMSFQGIFYWTPVFYCLLAHCLTYFLFFSFGVFCCMFTGSAGSVVLYFLTYNFLAMFLAALLSPLFEAYLLGYDGSGITSNLVYFLTPVHVVAEFFTIYGELHIPPELLGQYEELAEHIFTPNDLSFYMSDMTPMFVYLAVAVLMVIVALMVYKDRHIEAAGEAVAVPKMKPFFRLFVATLGGISVGMLFVVFITHQAGLSDLQMQRITPYVCIFWAIVFTFVAEMVLQKTFRVLKYWKGCIYSVLAVTLIFASIVFDFTGYEQHIPEESKVLDAQFGYISGFRLYPFDSINLDRLATEDGRLTSNQYAAFSTLHRQVIARALEEERNPIDENLYLPEGGDFIGAWKGYPLSLYLNYYDDNGNPTTRTYTIPYFFFEEDSVGNYFLDMAQDPEQVAYCVPFELIKGNMIDMNLSKLYDPESETFLASMNEEDHLAHYNSIEKNAFYDELLEALEKDLEEGNIGKKYLTPYDEDYISNGLFLNVHLYWTLADGEYAKPEVVTNSGQPLRESLTAIQSTNLAMTQQAVHTLAVLEAHNLFDGYEVMTYEQRMEQEMIWATSHSKTQRDKAASFYREYDDDTLSDIMTYVPAIS